MDRPQTRRFLIQEWIAFALVAVTLALLGTLILLPELRFVSTKLRYNDAAPIVYHTFHWRATTAKRGGRLPYAVIYSKRAGCHPPRGHGYISYRFAKLDGNRRTGLTYHVDAVRDANWPAGKRLSGSSYAPVPENLKPGRYAVWGEASFVCEGASQKLTTKTPEHVVTIL